MINRGRFALLLIFGLSLSLIAPPMAHAGGIEHFCMGLLKASSSSLGLGHLPTGVSPAFEEDLRSRGLRLVYDQPQLQLSVLRAARYLGRPQASSDRQAAGIRTKTWSFRPVTSSQTYAGEMALVEFERGRSLSRRVLVIESENQSFEGHSVYLPESEIQKVVTETRSTWGHLQHFGGLEIRLHEDSEHLRESYGSERFFWIEIEGLPPGRELFFELELLARLSLMKAPMNRPHF